MALQTMFKQGTDEFDSKLPPANQPAATPKDPNVLSLREWIEQAIQFVGKASGLQSALSSPEYLESAIKIAISLTEQIDLAETLELQYGISEGLEVLPISAARDWAGLVTVHLNNTQEVEATKLSSSQLEDQALAGNHKQEANEILDLFSDDEIERERELERSREGFLKSEQNDRVINQHPTTAAPIAPTINNDTISAANNANAAASQDLNVQIRTSNFCFKRQKLQGKDTLNSNPDVARMV
jgi:hypothetical protein